MPLVVLRDVRIVLFFYWVKMEILKILRHGGKQQETLATRLRGFFGLACDSRTSLSLVWYKFTACVDV